MKIRTMTATFGCLDGETLTLQDGLNPIVLPNEHGKSTWAAFLLAMLYGIDTAERSAKGRMAAKTKYQPWNGKAMSGILEVEHHGRVIVLERTSLRNKPMQQFRAYDKETGRELPEITGDNCGQYFLGVERSVFSRSAFLSGDELAVTQDEALAQRLENLAATGQVQDNYPAAAAKLKLWKNRCRYHQNGLIPETEAKLEQVRETLSILTDLRRQRMEAVTAWERSRADVQAREADEEARWKREKDAAAAQLAEATALAERTALKAAQLPDEEALLALLAKTQQPVSAEQPEPPCPPALDGLSPDAILPKVQRDVAEYDKLASARPFPSWVCLALAGLFGAAFVLLGLLRQTGAHWLFLPLLSCLWIVLFFHTRKKNKAVLAGNTAAKALLAAYGADTKDAMLDVAMDRRDWLMARQLAQRQGWETELLLEEVQTFAPETRSLADAAEAVKKALKRRRQAIQAQADLERTTLQWQAISRRHDPALDAEKETAAALRLQAETLRSKEEALGGWEKQEAKRQRLEGELEALYQREAALSMAQEAMAAAHDQLEQVYAPRLTALSGEYLRKLTNGRYDALILRQGLELLVRETDTALTRPLAALSSGTRDQAWLSLRLAMTRLLLPADAPILLDDALMTFDQERTALAIKTLEEDGRQVILFQCK